MTIQTLYIISVCSLAVALIIFDIRFRILRDRKGVISAKEIISRTQHRKR